MSLLSRCVARACAWVPLESLEALAGQLLRRIASELPPRDALTTLLRIDHALYHAEGRLAIACGDGVHPKHRLTNYHQFFTDRIRAGERVLDVGCGRGELAHDVAERCGATVVAVDIDTDYLAQARERETSARVEYVQGDINEGIPDGAFDVVILSNVLEHLHDRSDLLARLVSAARPSRILIRVPVFERDWRVPLRRELGVEWRLDPTHETEYTLESFTAEVNAAGVTVADLQVRWGEIWATVTPCDARADAPEHRPAAAANLAIESV